MLLVFADSIFVFEAIMGWQVRWYATQSEVATEVLTFLEIIGIITMRNKINVENNKQPTDANRANMKHETFCPTDNIIIYSKCR